MYILLDKSILNPRGDLKPQTISELASVIFLCLELRTSPSPLRPIQMAIFPLGRMRYIVKCLNLWITSFEPGERFDIKILA